MVEGSQARLAWAGPGQPAAAAPPCQVGIASVTLPRTVIVKLNATLPGLQDVRVRQALSLSIDRAGIAHALMGDEALAATQLLPPPWPTGTTRPAPLRHDPEAAQRLLREAIGSATAMACAGRWGSRWCCPSAPFRPARAAADCHRPARAMAAGGHCRQGGDRQLGRHPPGPPRRHPAAGHGRPQLRQCARPGRHAGG